MTGAPVPRPGTYAGLGVVALATLMYEIILTRIFSVTMWYHFAFVAVSVAMFGMTVGAVIVYVAPRWFGETRLLFHLGLSAFLFGVSVVVTFLFLLFRPFGTDISLFTVPGTILTYALVGVPFVFSGICGCLALTRFRGHVASLYAVHLIGAAIGCLLVLLVLGNKDGPTAIILVGSLACMGARLLLVGQRTSLRAAALFLAGVFALTASVLEGPAQEGTPQLRLSWVKGKREGPLLYEKWNAFSRITVLENTSSGEVPFGWGLSSAYQPTHRVEQLTLQIDGTAGTVLTRFDGDVRPLEHLKFDVTNVAHYLRSNGRVLVIGVGGGRDILTALLFRQQAVVGVEINEDILVTLNVRFGDFTGHLERRPEVTFVNDEARSWAARVPDRFDIIQISLVDTWAATAAGAFTLTESALYTVEAWDTFLDRLTDRGVLSVSRYLVSARPDEAYRLTSLARAALVRRGVADPRAHLAIVRHAAPGPGSPAVPAAGVATVLVSRAPFSRGDIEILEATARALRFDVLLSPRHASDETFSALASSRDLQGFLAAFPVNVAAPTDDRPFFFHMMRLRDAVRRVGTTEVNHQAVTVLGSLLVTVVSLTLLCIVVPVTLAAGRAQWRGGGPLLLFFAGIGLGFMLIEISQMQRLIIFLGHPTYSLSVVLFALLLASGVGSAMSGRLTGGRHARSRSVLLGLVGVLAATGIFAPGLLHAFEGATTPVRIGVAVAMLLPIGFAMGMAFPVGMRVALERAPALAPWLWGINGATSVCASVLAVVIALGSGISTAFWAGVTCYAVAFVAYALVGARDEPGTLVSPARPR
jgi:hypothetical protein